MKRNKNTKRMTPHPTKFNNWWSLNYNHQVKDLYKLLTVDRVPNVCQIPRSFTKSRHTRTIFREFLLKYINLFKADTGIKDLKQLPIELPKCKLSPFVLRTSPSCNSLGIFANKRLAKNTVIDYFPVYKIQLTGEKYEQLVDKNSDNLAQCERLTVWGKPANQELKVFYCIEGPVKFLNHACSPHHNLLQNDSYTLYKVLSTIPKNRELFIDYGDNFFTEEDPCTNPICCPRS